MPKEQPQSLESQLKMARPRRHEVERVPLTPEEKEFLGKIMDNAVAAEKAGKLKEALDFYTDYKNELSRIKERIEKKRKRQESREPLFNTESFDLLDDINQQRLLNKNVSKLELTDKARYELSLSLNKDYLEDLDLKEFRKKSDEERQGFIHTLPIWEQVILEVEDIKGLLVGSIYIIDEQHEEFYWHIVSNIEPEDILKKDELGNVEKIETQPIADETEISMDSGAKILFGTKYEDETGYTTVFFSEK